MKHIRWIAVVGLIAIVELQYVWLVNTYKLTRENVMRQSHELFKDAALKEAFDRMGLWKELHGKKDSTYTYRFDLNEDVEDDETQTPTSETRQFIESAVFIAIQEGVSNTFKMDVSLHNLDSIYAHMLDSVGIPAKVSTCVTDSLGNVLRASSPQAKLEGQKYLRTRLVPINKAYTRYLQGVILNPYWVIFQRMTLLLIATVLIMVLVIICIVYQIRVIIRQDKIAKVREDFSYAMIHDMKTPLSSILMGTEILESGRLDGQPEKKERYFRIVKEEGEHLLALTNKVLTLSKLENHALKLQQTDCLLRPILEDLAEKYKAKTAKQVAFVWNLQEEVVWADEEFLREALSNLIDNALKYSGEAVEITFLSERKADGTVDQIRNHKRKMNIVSRGGSLVFAWMCMTGEENPFYEYYDEILDICREYDVTISLGDACRPGCLADASDVCQIEELVRLGELTKRAWEKDVQVMVEGPGHMPMDQIAANMKIQNTICGGAPFYVLGPLVTDIAPGYDHITSAIGGAIAAASGAAFLCYVTPAEHLALPNLEDVKQGIIASKIAAHAADIAKGVRGAREMDDRMADARRKLDWEAQWECAIDPETAKRIREERKPEHEDTCSMCGKFCAVRSMNKALAGEHIDIL